MLDYLPGNISSFGHDIDGVMAFINALAGTWFVAAELLLLWFLIRYRRQPGRRAAWLPADNWKQARWVLIPCMVVFVCDIVIEAKTSWVWAHVKEEIPEVQDLQVKITGSQFQWRYTYQGKDGKFGTDDDVDSMTELVVPAGKVVRFQLEATDVLHSYWVPSMRLKQDAVPGRSIPGWFQANEEGTYTVACAELCGVGHTIMKSSLRVVSPPDFDKWMADQIKAQESSS